MTTNLRFLNAIGLFPAKCSINHWNSNLTAKINSGGPQGPLTLHMCKTESKFSNHKNRDNSEAIGSSNLKFSQNFRPLPPAVQKLSPKGSFLVPFKTLDWIPFKTPNICKTQHYSYVYESSFQDPTWCHCNHHFCSKHKVRSFQDPQFSLFPGPWQMDSLFFSPQSSTGMQRTSNWCLTSGRVRSTLVLHASSINQDIWFAMIIGYLSKEGFKQWNTLPISTDEEAQKDLDQVFKVIMDTLEVLTSYWNHINEIYSNIKQGNNESTDQLDQRIKNLVERCQYSTEEKLVCRTELLFHATKHFEVKKWVWSKKRWDDVTYQALLQYAKEHEMTVKDFKRHKLNGGVTQLMTVNAIKTFKWNGKKGTKTSGSYRTSGQSTRDSKTCSKCNTMHQFKDCPAFGKKCHKCGFKNHFSSCCRSSWSNGHNSDRCRGRTPAHGRSTERCHRPTRGRHSRSRSWSRSGSQTRNAHSIEIDRYDIDDIDVLRTFHSISRSRSVAAILNDTDPDGKMKILTKLKSSCHTKT